VSHPVSASDVERFGKIVEHTTEQVAIEVPRGETVSAAAALLQALPVIDIAIEEVDIEDAIRSLFNRTDPSSENSPETPTRP
jgi:ABC-type uncharacterized transport system ATPase subunit